MFKQIFKYIFLFISFGLIYFVIECMWKNKLTDWRMAVLGGCLGIAIGCINNAFTYKSDILLQGIVGSLAITVSEAVLGYYWNTIQGLDIWDYSKLPFTAVAGNVNALFSIFAWIPLSWLGIIIDDSLRYYVLKESDERPYYVLFGKRIFSLPKRRCA